MNSPLPLSTPDAISPIWVPGSESSRPNVALPPVQSPCKRSVRVLHLINGEHYSGAERVQDLLALYLPKHGYQVTFACLKPGRFPTTRLSQDTPLLEAAMHSRHSLGIAWHLADFVRSQKIPLLHSHTPRTALIGSIVAKLTGRPLVHHVHSPTSRDSTRYFQNLANTWVERFSMGQSARLIAVSTSLAEWVARLGIPRDRIDVVANGVPTATVIRPPVVPKGTWVLGSVALFRPRKGLEILLRALAELRTSNYDVRLRAIGPFETVAYEQSIRHLARQLHIEEAIDWVGFTNQVADEMAKLDLFILPSLFGEGLPMVLLEAMAAGVPCVATRVEGIPEAIRPDVDGVLVAPNDANALANGIRRVLTGELDWQSLRRSAIARHADRFSADGMAHRTAAVYNEVLFHVTSS